MKKIPGMIPFLGWAFGLSYGAAALFYALGGRLGTPAGTAFGVGYMFTPTIAVLIVQYGILKTGIRKNLWISFRINRWFLVAWLLPPVIGLGSLGISLLLPGVSYSPHMEGMFARFQDSLPPEQLEEMRAQIESLPIHPLWLSLLGGLLAGLTVNAVAGFGEELGWRGFLVDRLRSMPFFRAAWIIGLLWGLWHAPMILMGHNYPNHPVAGVAMMTAWCLLLSPSFLYVMLKARSVIAASIMHGTLNGTAGISILMVAGGHDLLIGITGLAGFLALLMVNAVLFIYDRRIAGERVMTRPVGHSLDPSAFSGTD